MQRHQTRTAGAYLTGPAMPNPAALFSYSLAPSPVQTKQISFTTTPTETSLDDEAVRSAIERLTKAPGNDPDALLQAALDMELVIRHIDSLSEDFGPEAALTSLALRLAENSKNSRKPSGKTRIIRHISRRSRYSKN